MQYFIMMPDDDETSAMFEANLLGEDNGFGVFWSGSGLRALMRVVEINPELLPSISIKTDKNETLTVTEFLDKIKKLEVRIK